MLTELFPQVHSRYSSLPVLGPILDGFAEWLFQQRYRRALVRRHLRAARHVDAALPNNVVACRPARSHARLCLPACRSMRRTIRTSRLRCASWSATSPQSRLFPCHSRIASSAC